MDRAYHTLLFLILLLLDIKNFSKLNIELYSICTAYYTVAPGVPNCSVLRAPPLFLIQAEVVKCGTQRGKTTQSIKVHDPIHIPVWSRLKLVIGYMFHS